MHGQESLLIRCVSRHTCQGAVELKARHLSRQLILHLDNVCFESADWGQAETCSPDLHWFSSLPWTHPQSKPTSPHTRGDHQGRKDGSNLSIPVASCPSSYHRPLENITWLAIFLTVAAGCHCLLWRLVSQPMPRSTSGILSDILGTFPLDYCTDYQLKPLILSQSSCYMFEYLAFRT